MKLKLFISLIKSDLIVVYEKDYFVFLILSSFFGCKRDDSVQSLDDPSKAILDEIISNIPKSVSVDYREVYLS